MRTITFYSYKGGVGRTLAAANFAVYLAKLGQKTVVIDFDLEAPGMDSKFPALELPDGQKGILDYVLDYQLTNVDPGSIEQICLQVPVESSGDNIPLWLIPAGDYRSSEYYRKLNQLDWSLIFSEEREGVAFFQEFLARINRELQPDFVIIDSRTGIGEIAGFCTQQLADEVMMLSSLSAESIKMTGHIGQLIRQSEIAEALGKSIDVKVVVSRVPKPEDLEVFKKRCCELFEVDETKLFFLFSCPTLELEEFLAIAAPNKDDELVAGYVRLFYGLNIELAGESIKAEIERIAHGLLFTSPEEAENGIMELVALYPHSEVYRAAMRFFRLVNKTDAMRNFGWKLLDFVPGDEEAQRILAKSYLADPWLPDNEVIDAARAIEPSWRKEELTPEESVRYANILVDTKQFSESLDIALPLCDDERLNEEVQIQARSIAVQAALQLGKGDIATELIPGIPPKKLHDVVQQAMKIGDMNKAFEIAKQILQHGTTSEVITQQAFRLAHQLNRVEELEEEDDIPF